MEERVRLGLTTEYGPSKVTSKITASALTTRVEATFEFALPEPTVVDGELELEDAMFSFPLLAGAAVVGVTAQLLTSGRTLVGQVERKKEAEKKYKSAVSKGNKAVLMQAASSEEFSLALGHCVGREEVHVTVTYVMEIESHGDQLELTLPIWLKPKFSPSGKHRRAVGYGDASHTLSLDWRLKGTRATSVSLPSYSDPENLSTPFTSGLNSRGSRLRVKSWTFPPGAKKFLLVRLALQPVTLGGATSDHSSNYSSDSSDSPGSVVFGPARSPIFDLEAWDSSSHDAAGRAALPRKPKIAVGGHAAVVSVVTPPVLSVHQTSSDPMEYVFLIDRSGSMGGRYIGAAQQAMQILLRSLAPGSFFSLIGFGSDFEDMMTGGSAGGTPKDSYEYELNDDHRSARDICTVPYTQAKLEEASRAIDKMKANLGGTVLLDPLQAILNKKCQSGMRRSILVLTDGAVSNTDEVLELIETRAAKVKTRVYALGIGSGSSRELVTGLARVGGGQAAFIQGSDRQEFARQVVRILDVMACPVEVSVEWLSSKSRVDPVLSLTRGSEPPRRTTKAVAKAAFLPAPTQLPMCSPGDRVLAMALFGPAFGPVSGVRITFTAEGHGSQTIELDAPPSPRKGRTVHQLAASRAAVSLGGVGRDDDNDDAFGLSSKRRTEMIAQLGLAYGIVTTETSFVAVDESHDAIVPVTKRSPWKGGRGGGRRAGAATGVSGRAPKKMAKRKGGRARVMDRGEASSSSSCSGSADGSGSCDDVDSYFAQSGGRRRHEDPVLAVARLQTFDGTFDAQACDVLGAGSTASSIPKAFKLVKKDGKDKALRGLAWTTAVVCSVLQSSFSSRRGEWHLLVVKALRWLDAHVKGGSAKALSQVVD